MDNSSTIHREPQYGKVLSYNQETGTIVSNNTIYIFTKTDLSNCLDLKTGDFVSFIPNQHYFGKETTPLAKFIKKIKEPDDNQNEFKM